MGAAVAGAVLLCAPSWAFAHGISLFAWAEGATIRGEAYFSGGGRARNAKIDVLDAGGRRIGETSTDAEGMFRFVATRRQEHRFVLATADGHRAECKVNAADLPDSLAGAAAVPSVLRRPVPATRPAAQTAPAAPTSEFPAALRQEIRQAVRRELAEYEQRTRIRDVIGGIGYIFGLAGLAVLLRRRPAPKGLRKGP